MAAQITVNPWSTYGTNLSNGLNSIIGAIGGSTTISAIVSAVVSYITSTYGFSSSSPQIQNELEGICYNAINMYTGNNVLGGQAGYNRTQMGFIQMLIGSSFTTNVPITAISNYIADAEDNIGTAMLGTNVNMPLFLCTTMLTNAVAYWTLQVNLGGSSSWHSYFPTSPENYMDIGYYTAAAGNGALAGYSAGCIDPSTSFYSNIAVAALAGALAVTTCKVVLGSSFIPRIQHSSLVLPGSNFNMSTSTSGRRKMSPGQAATAPRKMIGFQWWGQANTSWCIDFDDGSCEENIDEGEGE